MVRMEFWCEMASPLERALAWAGHNAAAAGNAPSA